MGTPDEHRIPRVLKFAAADPFLEKISAAYNGYLDQVVDCFEGSSDTINQHADLWEAVTGQGLSDELHKTATGSHRINPMVIFGSMAGAAALSEWMEYERKRAMMNSREPTSPWQDVIADNPKLVTLLAGIGALHQQGSTLPRRIAKGVGAAIKG